MKDKNVFNILWNKPMYTYTVTKAYMVDDKTIVIWDIDRWYEFLTKNVSYTVLTDEEYKTCIRHQNNIQAYDKLKELHLSRYNERIDKINAYYRNIMERGV